MTTDWYRNSEWSESIESDFDAKLKRARRKSTYLRIQACTLAKTHPEIALKLLDRYFELDDDFDDAQAFVDQATAYVTLNRIEDAVKSYSRALQRETQFPKLKTDAYIHLPFMIATKNLAEHYELATSLLDEHQSRLMFPYDHFRWNCARALISFRTGDALTAKQSAQLAISAAKQDNSRFRYHPNIGLVGDKHSELMGDLERIAE